MGLLDDLPIPLPIFYAVATVYVAYYCLNYLLKIWCERYYQDPKCQQRAVKIDRSITGSDTSCSSPNCVRCNTYKQLLSYAKCKIEKLEDSELTDRVKEAVKTPLSAALQVAANINFESKIEQNPNVLFVQGLKALPFWTHWESLTADVQLLEDNYEIILDEFEKNLNLPETDCLWTYNSTPAGAWDVLHLYNQGQKVDTACELFPKASAVIQHLSNFMRNCAFGNATFSVIHSNTLIAEHYGPCNVRIRCHLGLQVPENKKYQHCGLTVANKTKKWHAGRCLVFDDSFLHKAEYVTIDSKAEPRIVFMVDLWHPDLTQEERAMLTELFSVSRISNN